MLISGIVAKSLNHVIGVDNRLPWRLPADLSYFKQLTLNHHIMMGRKTFESIGKPLPQRTSIILTKDTAYNFENTFVTNSIQKGIEFAEQNAENELFIIGGAEIYRLAMPLLNRLYVTEVQVYIEGDKFFPLISEDWQEINREKHSKDLKNIYDYEFVMYQKRIN
jgi:dihydrofolate reductase